MLAKLRDIESVADAALSRLGPQELLVTLVDRVRQALGADTTAVLLLDMPSGHLVATAASGLEEEVQQGVRVPVGKGFAGRIAAEDRCVILEEVDHTKVVNPLLLDKGIRSLMGAPLRSGGKVIGVMHAGTLRPRRFTSQDMNVLQIAADRAATAMQALRAQTDREAAAALQRSLLPSARPVVAGLRMAARYAPGSGTIGGDWHDAFVLPSGQVCAVVGDVAGSGLPAAVIMGRMRSVLRVYAMETSDPAEMLDRLDRKMRHFEPDALATVLQPSRRAASATEIWRWRVLHADGRVPHRHPAQPAGQDRNQQQQLSRPDPVGADGARLPRARRQVPQPPVNYAAFATANGGFGIKVTGARQVGPALAGALSEPGPALGRRERQPRRTAANRQGRIQQAKKFAEAFLRGQPRKATIATTLFKDKIE